MKKILLVIAWFFLINSIVLADDTVDTTDTTPIVTGVSYDWYLSNDSVIKITGNNLWTCKDLKVWSKSISIVWKTETEITYNFKDSLDYTQTITMNCNWIWVNYLFSFPYIKSITWFKDSKFDWLVTISWQWFWDSPSIELSWGTNFEKVTWNDNSIYWKLDIATKSNLINVNVWWLKSNLYSMPIKLPYITHIVSKTWFSAWEIVTIYWTNLNSYNDFKVKFWDNYLDISKYDTTSKTISFVIPSKLWKFAVWVYSNWFLSNTIDLNIVSWRPQISKVEESTVSNTDWTSSKVLNVYWKNFWNSDVTKVYLNWSESSIKEFTSEWLIQLEWYLLNTWDNYFEIETNWKRSYVYNLQTSSSRLPEIGWYNINSITNWNKIISIYTTNYNKNTDKIYFNWSELAVDWINSNALTVSIDDNILSWVFTIWRWAYINPNKLTYDSTYESTPYITTVTFAKTPAKSVRIEIKWWNFSNASFSQSNFVSIKEDWTPDVSISWDSIIWYFPADYDINTQSTFSISKNGLDTNISFVWKDLWTATVIYWQPLIKKLVSTWSDWMFKPWVKVEIISKNLHTWDVVNIWEKKVWIVYVNNWNSYFIMPQITDFKEYDITITNKFWQTSKPVNTLIVDNEYKDNVIFDNNTIEKKNFYTDDKTSLSNPVYSLKITNKIQDLKVKKLTFKVSNYSKDLNYWTYYITLNWQNYANPVIINDSWLITFEYVEIPKSNTDIIISLYKSSNYIGKTSYKITFDTQNLFLVDSLNYEFKNFETSTFISNTINVYESNSSFCLDSESSNFYCNTYNNWDSTQTVSEIDTSKNTTQTDSKSQLSDSKTIFNTQINIAKYNFKTKWYNNLNTQFLNFWKSAVSNPKYSTKLWDIEKTINNILKSLYWYDNAKAKSVEKKLYLKKLKLDLAKFKELIK